MLPKRIIMICLISFMSTFYSYAQQDSVIDDAGDIAFVAYSAGTQDGYAFVLLDDCPSGTTIKFIDEEWTGSTFYTTNGEGENTWTNSTGGFISKGTVIIVESADNNPTVNLGSITESNAGFDIASTSPDQIFAIVGSRASPTFIAMIGHTSLPNNGSGNQQTLSGTGLVVDSTCIHLTSQKIYVGATTFSSLGQGHKVIHTDTNWQSISNNLEFPDDVTTTFGGTALPVLLTSFELKGAPSGVSLFWSTGQEIDNAGFDIQCKTSAGDWENIAFIPGCGSCVSLTNYSYVYTKHIREDVFFRLKQIDFDGRFVYSPILKYSNFYEPERGVSWQKSSDGVIIVSEESALDRVYIFDEIGKLVHQASSVTQQYALPKLHGKKGLLYALIQTKDRYQWLVLPYFD